MADIPYAPGELLVKYDDASAPAAVEGKKALSLQTESQRLRRLHQRFALKQMIPMFRKHKESGSDTRMKATADQLKNTYRLTFGNTSANMEALAWEYAKDPTVEYAVPNYRWQMAIIPDDHLYLQQRSHQNMDSESGWEIETGSDEVIVAIIDTGVDWNHPDLAANIWSNALENPTNGIDDDTNGYIDDIRGWDFVDVTQGDSFPVGEDIGPEDNDPMDFYGHGTVVAGVASAVGNNDMGVAGISWGCLLLPLRVGVAERDSGNAYTSLAIGSRRLYAMLRIMVPT